VKLTYLLKCGELVLKGLNRRTFEDVMLAQLRTRLSSLGKFDIKAAQSTVYITPEQDIDEITAAEVLTRLQKLFGVVSVCVSYGAEKNMESIFEVARKYIAPELFACSTFKVEARRSDKKFPFNSPQICRDVGEVLLESCPHLTVDVHEPDAVVNVEVRETAAYLHIGSLPGAGGMPTGTGGKAGLLLSGGIDSPVAGWLMAKRGVKLVGIHFFSPPYTSDRAREKVIDLAKILSSYVGEFPVLIVPFTKIQELIRENCPEEYFTLIMRRMMMRIAQKLAFHNKCRALVTGESLGQVASQTMDALCSTDAVVDKMPVFRPLIGLDKEEIVRYSRKIGAFETSILPYEDCCTVFTPKHPKTRPQISELEKAEACLDVDALVKEAIEGTEKVIVCDFSI